MADNARCRRGFDVFQPNTLEWQMPCVSVSSSCLSNPDFHGTVRTVNRTMSNQNLSFCLLLHSLFRITFTAFLLYNLHRRKFHGSAQHPLNFPSKLILIYVSTLIVQLI